MLINNKNLIKTIKRVDLTTEQEANLNEISNIKNNIDNKVDKITGKQLSTEDYTSQEKTDLANLKTIIGDNNSGLVKDVTNLKNNGVSQDNINSAIEDYLTQHPVQSGATAEQAAQLQTNTTDIANIKTSLNNKVDSINVYTKTEINTKLDEIQAGGLTLREVLEDEIFISLITNEVFGEIILTETEITLNENSFTTFSLCLDKAPTNNQIINLNLSNEYCTLDKTSLTFTPDNYSTKQYVKVSGIHDTTNYTDKSTTITLTSNNIETKYITANIKNVDTVPEGERVPVTGISLNVQNKTLSEGESYQLIATVEPENATDKTITFNSSNPDYVTVTTAGLIIGKAIGSSIITATTRDGNFSATCNISVAESTYETENLSAYYDLTKYTDGYSGEIEDLSGNGVTVTTTGLGDNANYTPTTGLGFKNNSYLVGTYSKGASNITVSFNVNCQDIVNNYPFTVELYLACVSYKNPVNGDLTYNDFASNSDINLFSTRWGGSTGSGYNVGYRNSLNSLYLSGNANNPNIVSELTGKNASDIFTSSTDSKPKFNHFVFCIGDKIQKIYLNGELISDSTANSIQLGGDRTLSLGNNTTVKLLRVYNSILSQDSVRKNYNHVLKTIGGNI